jgi:hypothetical protein
VLLLLGPAARGLPLLVLRLPLLLVRQSCGGPSGESCPSAAVNLVQELVAQTVKNKQLG